MNFLPVDRVYRPGHCVLGPVGNFTAVQSSVSLESWLYYSTPPDRRSRVSSLTMSSAVDKSPQIWRYCVPRDSSPQSPRSRFGWPMPTFLRRPSFPTATHLLCRAFFPAAALLCHWFAFHRALPLPFSPCTCLVLPAFTALRPSNSFPRPSFSGLHIVSIPSPYCFALEGP